jgi:hypothetical protein
MILLFWACKTGYHDTGMFLSEGMASGVACKFGIDRGLLVGQEAGWACIPLEALEVPTDLTDDMWLVICGGFVPDQLPEESQYFGYCHESMRSYAELCYRDAMTSAWYTSVRLADCLPTCVQVTPRS